VKCLGEKRGAYRVLGAKHESTRPLGSTRCRLAKTIKTGLQGIVVVSWTGFIWLRIGTLTCSCECGDEISCSIKFREFFGQLRNYQFLTEDSIPWS
jgi:hypothetical protein